jgi:hypothetical protein
MKKLLFTIFSLYMFQSVQAQGILDKFNKKLNTDSTSKTNRSINDLINRKPGGNKLSSEEMAAIVAHYEIINRIETLENLEQIRKSKRKGGG